VQDIIEKEQLLYFVMSRILLKWSSCSTLHGSEYYWNGAVTVLYIVQDIIEKEQLQYCT